MASYKILNVTRQTNIATRIHIAKTARERRVGLLKHTHLEIGEGILVPARSWLPLIAVHTVGMKFPIDVFFLDWHNRVLEICTLPPNQVACVLGARWVLETAQGIIIASWTRRGDQIEFKINPLVRYN
ncbi:DUF192 domain-containing protein [Anaerolineae bacterium CFX7]|nr:DUF192 domain-containing protein [Anaerolineae bacterium CFX7]